MPSHEHRRLSPAPSSRALVLVALATLACAHDRAAQVARAHLSGARATPIALRCDAGSDGADEDHDGLPDACERELAERFAPVVYHSSDETNFPTDVDVHLRAATLSFYDDACAPDLVKKVAVHPSQKELLDQREGPSCGSRDTVVSSGTRSAKKQRTFFLGDVDAAHRRGSEDTREWTTYFHAYANDLGGVTLQYWRFYAYNDALNDHGGDWEGAHVVLDLRLRATLVRLLGHGSMEELPFDELEREGTHVRLFSEVGGHATRAGGHMVSAKGCAFDDGCTIDPDDARTFVRQETWTGGFVTFPDGRVRDTGRLVNVGAKAAPLEGQVFVRYSGLWGSPGLFYPTSGYWGPAYNETDMHADGFLAAWCEGMLGEDVATECYAGGTSR